MTKKTTGETEQRQNKEKEEKKCFVIMPISDTEGYPKGHFSEVYSQLIEPSVTAAGYECSLATSTSASHLIQLDVVTRIATAELCVCDLSTNNPNVLFEYGIRQAFDKPTVLIKDDKTRRIFDVSGFRDIEYDHTLRIANTLRARQDIQDAIIETMGGANDGDQVFSLVKLMKLTKASLPQGEVTKDDARFELLELKLDRMIEVINRINQRVNSGGYLPKKVSNPENRFYIQYEPDAVVIRDLEAQTVEKYTEYDELTKSPYYRQLPPSLREKFIDEVITRTNMLPF